MDDNRISISSIIFSDVNLDYIREQCAGGIDLNYLSHYGFTLFHFAVCIPEDNIAVVQELIQAGADVNIGNHLGFTPLHFAAIYRKPRVFNTLIHSGAFVNAHTFLGTTPLHFAVSDVKVVNRFIEDMSLPNIQIISQLLQHEDIDCNLLDSNGDSPLMVAVQDEQIEAAVKLLRNKADPNISNKESETPLHVAFSQQPNYIEIELLLSGASINAVNKMGKTPVDILLQNGLHLRTNEWVKLIMKTIAFKYSITSDFQRKLESTSWILQFFNKCYYEVDRMRIDFISGEITVHDFVGNCFNDDQFESILLQIHKPVVERLVRDIYPEYFTTILDLIPESSLTAILEITVRSKKHKEIMKNDLAYLFSIIDNILLISNYLSKMDVFCLIVAFSNVEVSDSMQNFQEREFSNFIMN